MRLGSHYVPLRVLVGWLAGFLVLLFEILGLPTCTRKTQYTTGLPAHFLWCLDAEEDWQGEKRSWLLSGDIQGQRPRFCLPGTDSFLQQGPAVACAERLCPGKPAWNSESKVFLSGCSQGRGLCLPGQPPASRPDSQQGSMCSPSVTLFVQTV